MGQPIDELAMEYVLFNMDIEEQEPGDLRQAMIELSWSMLQQMQRRIGDEHTKALIAQTKEILKMVGL